MSQNVFSGIILEKTKTRLVVALAALMGLSGCASTGKTTDEYSAPSHAVMAEEEVGDPIEPFNRAMFALNDRLDILLAKPMAKVYQTVVPSRLRKGVSNMLRNLNSPLIIANQTLQGDLEGAGHAVGRAVVNTTVGVGGFFDVGAKMGMPYEGEDLGQTLAVWGVPHGPYLVLPFFGPSSVRDAIGLGVESYGDPVSIWWRNTDRDNAAMARFLVSTTSQRADALGAIEEMKASSFDFYASMRSVYLQRRVAEVTDGRQDAQYDEFDSFLEEDLDQY